MWQSNSILVLNFATINFETLEINWQAGEFTPKRRNVILAAFEKGFGIDVSKLQNA